MNKSNIVLFCLLFVFARTVFAQNNPNKDYIKYADEKFPFLISYPNKWKSVDASLPEIRLEVINEEDGANFNIVVKEVAGSSKVSSLTFVNLFLNDNPKLIDQMATSLLSGAKVTSRGRTYLSNREAFFYIYEGSYRTMDETFDFKGYVLQMFYEGRVYTLGFGCEKDEFDKNISTFKEIASGFLVLPTIKTIPQNKKRTPKI